MLDTQRGYRLRVSSLEAASEKCGRTKKRSVAPQLPVAILAQAMLVQVFCNDCRLLIALHFLVLTAVYEEDFYLAHGDV